MNNEFWNQFWPQFWGGVASGVFLAIITFIVTYIARLRIAKFFKRLIDSVKNGVIHDDAV